MSCTSTTSLVDFKQVCMTGSWFFNCFYNSKSSSRCQMKYGLKPEATWFNLTPTTSNACSDNICWHLFQPAWVVQSPTLCRHLWLLSCEPSWNYRACCVHRVQLLSVIETLHRGAIMALVLLTPIWVGCCLVYHSMMSPVDVYWIWVVIHKFFSLNEQLLRAN